MQAEFPGDKGFSARNLWDMKRWYLYYSTDEAATKLHQLGAELLLSDKVQQYGLLSPAFQPDTEKLHQLGAEFPFGGIHTPLGVATYNGIRVSDVLPSEELLRQRVRQLEQELRLSRKLIHTMTEDIES